MPEEFAGALDWSALCSRCGRPVIAGDGGQLVDRRGRLFTAGLCQMCDAHRPAVAALIRIVAACLLPLIVSGCTPPGRGGQHVHPSPLSSATAALPDPAAGLDAAFLSRDGKGPAAFDIQGARSKTVKIRFTCSGPDGVRITNPHGGPLLLLGNCSPGGTVYGSSGPGSKYGDTIRLTTSPHTSWRIAVWITVN